MCSCHHVKIPDNPVGNGSIPIETTAKNPPVLLNYLLIMHKHFT